LVGENSPVWGHANQSHSPVPLWEERRSGKTCWFSEGESGNPTIPYQL
jgi:hypothetical protein